MNQLISLDEVISVAKGEKKSDLLLKNGNIVDVFSGEIYKGDIAIYKGMIMGIGDYQANNIVDLENMYVTPGFIDGHVHIESSMVKVFEFARAVVPRGTTSVVVDPHEIANVLGLDGIKYILETSKFNPLNVFIMLPSCVPATPLETAGSALKAFDLYPLLQEKWVLGLGEVMNYPGVLMKEHDVLDKIKISSIKRVDGHAPLLTGKDLCAYVAAGVGSEHECTTVEMAKERLRLGMRVMIREGTGAKNLHDLLPLVNRSNYKRFIFVTDDRHPHDLIEEGHIDYMIKEAIAAGLDPVIAVQIATINPAEYFGLNKFGAIAPGYYADLCVVDDLAKFGIKMVFKNGELVAKDSNPLFSEPSRPPVVLRSTINIKWLSPDDFKVPDKGTNCNVIGLKIGQIETEKLLLRPAVRDGFVVSDTERDILKVAVIERHLASDNLGLGLIKGMGLKRGAIASSVAHDSHNIITVGTSDEDMLAAVIQIAKMKGGLAVAADGKILESLPLPIAGLMSDRTLYEVKDCLARLNKAAHKLGVTLKDPFMTLSFVALPVIPELKITDKGIVDVKQFKLINLFE